MPEYHFSAEFAVCAHHWRDRTSGPRRPPPAPYRCPHCEYVISQTVPPLIQQYGDQLQIIGINVSGHKQGLRWFFCCPGQEIQPADARSGDHFSGDWGTIPERFLVSTNCGFIEINLAQGGVDSRHSRTGEAMAAAETAHKERRLSVCASGNPVELTWQQKFARETAGNVCLSLCWLE